jgi:hypothetical protein
MPIGYLVTTLLVACGVLGAVAPPRRPFIVAAWLVVSTLLALDQTGLGSPAGVAAVAVAVLAMAGLLLVVRRALLTGPALDRALTAGLGAGWRQSAGQARTRRRIMSGRVLFAPFWMRRPGVLRPARQPGHGVILAAGLPGRGRAAAVHRARRPGLADPGRNGPAVRQADARRLRRPGHLRRTARGPARLRPVPLNPLRTRRRRGRRLRRLGTVASATAAGHVSRA